jgi:cyclopropane fatty-acyl-phospholipid synthase-like methyltransferase
MKRQREVEFFDRFGHEHGDYDVLGNHAYRRLLDFLERNILLSSGSRVVNLGCGSGAIGTFLVTLGTKAVE